MREWSVDLKTLHTLGPDLTRVEAYVDDLVGILKPFAVAAGYDSLAVTARFNVRARTVDAALTKALRIFAASFKRIHFPEPPAAAPRPRGGPPRHRPLRRTMASPADGAAEEGGSDGRLTSITPGCGREMAKALRCNPTITVEAGHAAGWNRNSPVLHP